jgi:hypothetical protein
LRQRGFSSKAKGINYVPFKKCSHPTAVVNPCSLLRRPATNTFPGPSLLFIMPDVVLFIELSIASFIAPGIVFPVPIPAADTLRRHFC